MEDAVQLAQEVLDGTLVLRAGGKFDGQLGGEIRRVVDERGSGPVVLNLASVEYISSQGISMIVKVHSLSDLRLACLPRPVLEVLELSGIISMLRVFDDEAAALAAGAPAPSDSDGGSASG